jgi:SAM-dependent methyltransferase
MSDYQPITEMANDEITQEQIARLCHRYAWAWEYCVGRDVLEAACGTGPGLGGLAARAKRLWAGDYSGEILAVARAHYNGRIPLARFDAQALPCADRSLDVILLFEAIYYLPSAPRFVEECRRALRPGGQVLVATANRDLFDFNPSPQSHCYYGVVGLRDLFSRHGFSVACFGYLTTDTLSWRQRATRPLKKMAVTLGMMPQTAEGKKFLKRWIFGRLVPMPAELLSPMPPYVAPTPLPTDQADHRHKVLYCTATL